MLICLYIVYSKMADIYLYTSRHVHLFRRGFFVQDKCIKLLNYAAFTCNNRDSLHNTELQHAALTAGAVLFSPRAQVFFII